MATLTLAHTDDAVLLAQAYDAHLPPPWRDADGRLCVQSRHSAAPHYLALNVDSETTCSCPMNARGRRRCCHIVWLELWVHWLAAGGV